MAASPRLERGTCRLEGGCTIQLCYEAGVTRLNDEPPMGKSVATLEDRSNKYFMSYDFLILAAYWAFALLLVLID